MPTQIAVETAVELIPIQGYSDRIGIRILIRTPHRTRAEITLGSDTSRDSNRPFECPSSPVRVQSDGSALFDYARAGRDQSGHKRRRVVDRWIRGAICCCSTWTRCTQVGVKFLFSCCVRCLRRNKQTNQPTGGVSCGAVYVNGWCTGQLHLIMRVMYHADRMRLATERERERERTRIR